MRAGVIGQVKVVDEIEFPRAFELDQTRALSLTKCGRFTVGEPRRLRIVSNARIKISGPAFGNEF